MSNNSTSNDISLDYNVTQEQIDNFNLSNHLVSLLWNEPFYSRILRSLNKIETVEIPTAGVLEKDGNITLWWNRKFLASLNNNQVLGLLKHECLHLVFEHTTERKRTPHIIWNYATDLAINCLIKQEELPEGGLFPGKPIAFDKSKISPDRLADLEKLSSFIQSLPIEKSSEFYFEEFLKNEEIKQICENSEGFSFDSHDGWDSMSDEQKEIFKGKIKEIIEDAVNEAKCKSWGSIPQSIRSKIIAMSSKEISWESLLNRFVSRKTKSERISCNKKLSRKYPTIHAGIKKNNKPKIAVYIDESGSVSNEDLSKVYSELNSLAEKVEFYLYKFDTDVDEENCFLWKKGKKINLERTRIGGTCFKAPTLHALKNKNKIDGYVIMTDGYAEEPPLSQGLRRAWIITKNGTTNAVDSLSDTIIKLK